MYQINLLDFQGEVIASREKDIRKEAISEAQYMLSNDFAKTCETTHVMLGTEKVEVVRGNTCIYDKFL